MTRISEDFRDLVPGLVDSKVQGALREGLLYTRGPKVPKIDAI
jgi:hypothetical protein